MGELRGRVGSEVNSPALRRRSLGGLGERNGAEKSLGRGITFPIGTAARGRRERRKEVGKGRFHCQGHRINIAAVGALGVVCLRVCRPPFQGHCVEGARRPVKAGSAAASCAAAFLSAPSPGRLARSLPRSALAVLAAVHRSLPLGALDACALGGHYVQPWMLSFLFSVALHVKGSRVVTTLLWQDTAAGACYISRYQNVARIQLGGC